MVTIAYDDEDRRTNDGGDGGAAATDEQIGGKSEDRVDLRGRPEENDERADGLAPACSAYATPTPR